MSPPTPQTCGPSLHTHSGSSAPRRWVFPREAESWSHSTRFPDAAVIKNQPALAGGARDLGLTPRSGRSLEGNGNPLQGSCLENSMDRGAWRATVLGVTQSWTRLSTHMWVYLVLICHPRSRWPHVTAHHPTTDIFSLHPAPLTVILSSRLSPSPQLRARLCCPRTSAPTAPWLRVVLPVHAPLGNSLSCRQARQLSVLYLFLQPLISPVFVVISPPSSD